MDSIDLKYEWDYLMSVSGISTSRGNTVFDDISRAYSEPHRHYHTLDHLRHLLGILKQLNYEDCGGLWAVWYHDYVYQPGRQNNEKLSADKAIEVMKGLGLDPSIQERTKAIILATSSHQVDSVDEDFQIMLDADMAILGESPEVYAGYCQAVGEEFRAVPSIAYRMGRKRFIQKVLQQDRIFVSPYFYKTYEAQARQNLATELSTLK